MGIKPDHWIARMAREQRMIEPFQESLAQREQSPTASPLMGMTFEWIEPTKFARKIHPPCWIPKKSVPSFLMTLKGIIALFPPVRLCSLSQSNTLEFLETF